MEESFYLMAVAFCLLSTMTNYEILDWSNVFKNSERKHVVILLCMVTNCVIVYSLINIIQPNIYILVVILSTIYLINATICGLGSLIFNLINILKRKDNYKL